MNEFQTLFKQRSGRVLALSRLGSVALDALSFVVDSQDSKFDEHFRFMAEHIPDQHGNHPEIDIPEYKIVAFVDGLSLIMTISEMEAYIQDVIAAVAVKYPAKIGRETIDLNSLGAFDSIQDAVRYKARNYAAGLMFKNPNQYKKDLLNILSAPEALINEQWPIFIEAKARRDIGLHNDWLVNDVYRSKVREVDISPTSEAALSVGRDYMHSVRKACVDIMIALTKHCDTKFA